MEATVVSIAKSVLDGLLMAKSTIADEVALQLGVQRELAFIKDEFEMMQTFLMAADEEQSQNQVTKTWVKQVRDLAYDAEDCLQEFAVHLEKPSWWRSPCTLTARRRIATEIKELKARVEDVSKRNARYNLIKGTSGSKPAIATATVVSQPSVPAVPGQDEAAQVDLIHLIASTDEALRVVLVCGASDLGRLSVVSEVYDHPHTQERFKFRAWIKLMQPFNASEVLKSMMRQFHASSLVGKPTEEANSIRIKMMKMEMTADHAGLVHEDFIRDVNESRYLVVLDNLSEKQEWNWIKTLLPDGKNGSRIIVSTQHVEIAKTCMEQPNQVMESQINRLSYDQPLYLFFNKGQDSLANGSELPASVSRAGTDAADSEQLASSTNTETRREAAGPRQVTRTRTSTAWLEESQLIGRDKEKDVLVHQILEDGQQWRVISVWGMGGIGKTSLVRQVYNSPELSGQRFQCRAWITVFHPFNPEEFLRALLRQLYSSSSGRNRSSFLGDTFERRLQSMPMNELKKECEEHLKERMHLIVFDDLSTVEEWKWINSHLRHNKASRIIVTTREERVAKCCAIEDRLVNELHTLTNDAALDLFCKKVFFKEAKYAEMSADMTEQANLILKRCGGLPLAIITIGGFLANKPKTTMEWKKLHDHISAELENNPTLGMIKTTLYSSYVGLPYHLKSCFLYLGIFPEGHSIRRKRLVRRWMAEGYLRKMRGMTIDEIGEASFFDLISRSMIQASKLVPTTSGIPKSCHLHDMMREVSISSAAEENLLLVLDEHGNLNSQDKIRHLVVSNTWSRDKKVFKGINLLHTRSLTVFGEWRPFFISCKMKMLRVLDLEGSSGLEGEHLQQICELRCLRYLGLRGTYIFHLPDSIGRLQDLQTLDIRDTFVLKLPNTVAKLRRLQYLRAAFVAEDEVSVRQQLTTETKSIPFWIFFVLTVGCLFSIGVGKLPCIQKLLSDEGLTDRTVLHAVPIIVKSLIEGVDIYGVKVPRRIGKLKCLQTLGVVNIARGKAVLKELRKLTQLRKLGVTGITKKNSKKLCSTIADLTNLQSLSMRSEDEQGLSGLDDVSSAPKHLQSLKLCCNNLGKLPNWVQQLSNLVKINLRSTMVELEAIQVLKQLPSLTILRLLDKSFAGKELHFDEDGFLKLEVLELNLKELKSVKFEKESLPKLEILQLNKCISLTDNGCSGLPSHGSLKEVLLQGRYTKAFIKNLQDQVDMNTKYANLRVIEEQEE